MTLSFSEFSGQMSRYRVLPAISGGSFLPISFLGRLPTTMVPLAVLTFTVASTGSYPTAGLASTATAAGTAIGAPLMGRLADRHGQRAVVSAAVALNAPALIALALLPDLSPAGSPGRWRVVLLVLCALIGLTLPQVGGLARARWLALTRRHAGTAMAYEGTTDELAYVLGPAFAGLLASLWGAPAALLLAAIADVLAVGAFALHPTHAVTGAHPLRRPLGVRVPGHGTSGRTEPGLLRPVLLPVLAMLLMGSFFAAEQSGLTVYAANHGRPAAGGLIYALMAVGSAGTALGTAALPERIVAWQRCAGCATGLLLGVALTAATVVSSAPVGLLCGAVFVTGLFVGPMLVTLNQVAGAAAPVHRAASAMAYLSAGSVIGIGLGATTAGALADATGGLGAFAVSALAALGLLSLAATALRRSEPRRPGPR